MRPRCKRSRFPSCRLGPAGDQVDQSFGEVRPCTYVRSMPPSSHVVRLAFHCLSGGAVPQLPNHVLKPIVFDVDVPPRRYIRPSSVDRSPQNPELGFLNALAVCDETKSLRFIVHGAAARSRSTPSSTIDSKSVYRTSVPLAIRSKTWARTSAHINCGWAWTSEKDVLEADDSALIPAI